MNNAERQAEAMIDVRAIVVNFLLEETVRHADIIARLARTRAQSAAQAR